MPRDDDDLPPRRRTPRPDDTPDEGTPRRARRDEEDTDPVGGERPKKSNKKLLVVLGIVAGVLVLGCGGASVVAWQVMKGAKGVIDEAKKDAERHQAEVAKKAKVWDKAELATAVKGKTPAQVIELLGKPDATMRNPDKDDGASFTYYSGLKNEFTGKVDAFTIEFFDGKAAGPR